MEISKFDVADIITVSGQIVNATTLEAGIDADLYESYKAQGGANTNVAVFEW